MTGSSSVLSGCPDENRLASYIDGRLPEDEMRQLRTHMVTCAACRTAVAEVLRDLEALDDSPLPALPESVRRQVEGLVTRPVPETETRSDSERQRFVTVGQWAALAAAVLVVGIAIRYIEALPPVSIPGPPRSNNNLPENHDMRGEYIKTFTTLFPKDQTVLVLPSPAALVLEWSAYGGHDATPNSANAGERVSYYEATVLDQSRRTIWSGRTVATRISPPASARIVPGATYTWSVVAHLTFGTSLETRPASFTVSR